ncbi:hypothetical protein VTK56DRAFT_10146 [Thermocarpiscus australiensis]
MHLTHVPASPRVAGASLQHIRTPGRSRRAHRKSRGGCANCKLRRVKCDESKPQCQRCVAYGVVCGYSTPGRSAMDLPFVSAFEVDPAFLPRSLPEPPIRLPLADPRGGHVYEIRPTDRALLVKFQSTPILTNGAKARSIGFQGVILKLAYMHPWLMHAVIALAHLHNMSNAENVDDKAAGALVFHFVNAISLFNAKLSQPAMDPQDRDPVWAAAAMLGVVSFGDTRARSPEEAWPLAASSPLDLTWIKMCTGKSAVRQLADPQRPDSIFSAIDSVLSQVVRPAARVGDEVLRHLPPRLAQLCRLDASSNLETNPYHAPATVLAQVMPLQYARETMPRFLSFLGSFDQRFIGLLREKDSCALLVLAYWYAKVWSAEQWWIYRRARCEGPAICALLEMRFAGDAGLLQLLEFPKVTFATDPGPP